MSYLQNINTIGKISDCIPVISTLTNGFIILYRLAHKVDNTVNSQTNSWKDDLKIHILSKDALIAAIATIPVVGNFVAFVHHLVNTYFQAEKSTSYILTTACGSKSSGLKDHNLEIVQLYAERQPKILDANLFKCIYLAAQNNRFDILKTLIGKSDRKEFYIKEAFNECSDMQMAESILAEYRDIISIDYQSYLINLAASDKNATLKLKLLLNQFPDLELAQKKRAIIEAINEKLWVHGEIIFNTIDDKHKAEVFYEVIQRPIISVDYKTIKLMLKDYSQYMTNEYLKKILIFATDVNVFPVDKEYKIVNTIVDHCTNATNELLLEVMLEKSRFTDFIVTQLDRRNFTPDQLQTISTHLKGQIDNNKSIVDYEKKYYQQIILDIEKKLETLT